MPLSPSRPGSDPPPPTRPSPVTTSGASTSTVAARLAMSLAAIVGPAHVLTDPDVVEGFTTDWTGRFTGPAALVVRPATSDQVAAVLGTCARSDVQVMVQGGNTGLVGGSIPPPEQPGTQCPPVILSTARLSEIGPVDTTAQQVTVGAGATLASVQQTARQAGLTFPVDLAARDSATIGGMVATNAGGLHVIRYGTMRRQVQGLQVVLADGTVVERLSGLLKDNTGYDLSQLMVGSEGTLGIVTAVRLSLVAHQPERSVALLGLDSTATAVALVTQLRTMLDGLSAAEIFYQAGMELVCRHAKVAPPFTGSHPVYLLLEASGRHDVTDTLAAALESAAVDESATAIADGDPGAERLWAYRERHTEAISTIGVPHKMDVTLPLGALAPFEAAVRSVVDDAAPGSELVLFGHVGDGNLHVNVVGPPADDDTVDEAVLRLVSTMGGSISAEHGIGRAKVPWLHLSRSQAELATMARIKQALDPNGLLNPGVLLPSPAENRSP